MIKVDYANARPLDVHRWSDYSEVNIFVNEIYNDLKSIKGNEDISKKLVKVILLDLYVAWYADHSLMLMSSRDNNAYKAKSRYNELHIGKKIIGIIDALVKDGVIGQKKGFKDRISGIGFQSRLWATNKLKAHFETVKFSQFLINRNEDWDPIILRDKDKKNKE